MDLELLTRVQAVFAADFELPNSRLQQRGTTLIPKENRTETSWLSFWPVGEQVVLEVALELMEVLQRLLARHPADYILAPADLEKLWANEVLEQGSMGVYMCDPVTIQPILPAEPYVVRQLTSEDRGAFEVFQARCSKADRDEGQIGLGDEVIFGVLDGERIVAGASVFTWRGFKDIGVLVDPDYRRRGLAKSLVAHTARHYIGTEHIPAYRHDTVNKGSEGTVKRVGFQRYATIASVRHKPSI